MRGSLSKFPALLSPPLALREQPFLSHSFASSPVLSALRSPRVGREQQKGLCHILVITVAIADGTAALNRGQTLATQPRSP